jgi:hypothetical protein
MTLFLLNMSDELLEKCELLLQEPEIRFAGFLDMMGNLITGSFRDNIKPLKSEDERKKMFIEAVLRIRTRQDFDENLGSVRYAAARRKNVVTFTFPLDKMVLFVSAEANVEIDKTAKKIMSICSIDNS